MPNTFAENRDRWMSLSEIDYLGQFVKAWLAFNAWYRNAYMETRDREIINEFKWNPNPVLNKLRPLLLNDTEDAQQYRAEIGLLHHRLENYELHCGKGTEKQRITLTNIYLRDNPPITKTGLHWGYNFTVERQANKQVRIEVKDRKGNIVLNHLQTHFDPTDLEAHGAFKILSTNIQGFLRQLYKQIAPQWVGNLTEGAETPIECGAHKFCCGRDALFAGVVEALYLMRCTLFHGELVPSKEAIACYEPAYRLVRRFIECVS
jgi:hypothetical protein